MKRTLLVPGAFIAAMLLFSSSAALGGPPGTFSLREDARGTAYTSEKVSIEAGKNVVVQSLILEPGWSSGWHHHPADAYVIMRKGKLTQYIDCNEKIVWEAGNAYYHAAGEHSTHPDHHGPQLAKNEGSEPVDILVIFPNVPQGQTPGFVPRDFLPPPQECPTLD
ncbi:MAG TPA: cupin domain-containing protein [Acidimicrobiia bacterium]